MSNSPILTVDRLTKRFTSEKTSGGISDITFDVWPGEVSCLVGPSGAGKTTLLRVLAGLEVIDSGSATFLGTQAGQSPRKDISMVFQDFNLWPHLTILENIVLAPITSHGIVRDVAEKQAIELLKKFDLFEKRFSYPKELSGGQRQRIAIIRALATGPKLLLLDEITSALDPELVTQVLRMIKTLAKEGQSMIIATHHLKFATEVAHKILFLEHGTLLQESSAHDFIHTQTHPRIQEFLRSVG